MTMLPKLLSDVSVTTSPVPNALDGAIARGVLWQAAEGRFLLDVPDVARYLVETGRTVTIDPAPDVPARKIEHFLGLLPLAALLYQRGMLAFHAAAVSNGDGVVLLAGDSGSGKSTLLIAMLQLGWRMLADDLAIVGQDDQGQPMVYPTRPGIALWPVSLEQLGIKPDTLPLCDANRLEYSRPEQFEADPQPLRGIYHLSVHNKREVELEEMAGNAGFKATGAMLYNSHVADALCGRVDYLRCTASLAQSVAFHELKRPRGVWSVNALANRIKI